MEASSSKTTLNLELSDTRTGLFDGISIKESAAVGAVRGLARIPFEHPFDTVKTKWQANPTYPNAKSVFFSIYRTQGFKEFYSGAIPSALRSLIKESYRFPLVIALPHMFGALLAPFFVSSTSSILSDNGNSNDQVKQNQCYKMECVVTTDDFNSHPIITSPERLPIIKVLSGVAIATVESITSCPFERIKILLMTRDRFVSSSAVLRNLFVLSPHREPLMTTVSGLVKSRPRNSSHNVVYTIPSNPSSNSFPDIVIKKNCSIFRYLYRGIGPLFLRQLVSWVSFLGADAKCKEFMRKRTNRDELNWMSLSAISIIVGVINTVVVMPVDAVKTQVQRSQVLAQSLSQSSRSSHSLTDFRTKIRLRLLFFAPTFMRWSTKSLSKEAHITYTPFKEYRDAEQVKRNRYHMEKTTGWNVARSIYCQQGLRGFYVGSSVRFCQYIISAFLTVPVLEYLEKKNAETRRWGTS